MVLTMRIVVGLIGAFFFVFGLRFMASPDVMAAQFFAQATTLVPFAVEVAFILLILIALRHFGTAERPR